MKYTACRPDATIWFHLAQHRFTFRAFRSKKFAELLPNFGLDTGQGRRFARSLVPGEGLSSSSPVLISYDPAKRQRSRLAFTDRLSRTTS